MKSKTNIMGSEVVDGFECKPKILDPNKPIMFYKYIIFVCVDKRCFKADNQKNNTKVEELRNIIKDLGLDRGKNRIKVSKSLCFGACRFKQVANIFANNNQEINNIWLKHIHKYDHDKLKELILNLKEDRLSDIFKKIPIKVYN